MTPSPLLKTKSVSSPRFVLNAVSPMNEENLFSPPDHDEPRPLRSQNKSEEDDADTWQIVEPLYRAAGWLRIIGILFLIFSLFGIVESIQNTNVIALIIVAFPLWAGFSLIHGSKQIQEAYRLGKRRVFRDAADKVRKSAIISAWIMVAYIVLLALLMYAFPGVF